MLLPIERAPSHVYTTKAWCEKIKIFIYLADLIAWLDTQERKPFSRVALTDEIVAAFDLLLRRRGAEDFALPERILEIYDRGQQG